MAAVGSACLLVGLLAALYAVGAALYGARSGRRQWVVSSRRAMYALAGLTVGATAIIQAAYFRSDFSFALVAENSSTTTPLFYKLTALWSSQAGSLLLWVLLLSLFSSAVLFSTRRRHREIAPYATAVLAGLAAVFSALMLVYASPFEVLAVPPLEGSGLNPLLRHPAMMIHPTMLYSGYVGFSVPFAFAVGALITRRTGADWIRSTRRYTLIAWSFLGFGILLGALWSYSELGWGGYWAWDPVENASLMPWLTGTAFLHSIMVQERRGMLKVWNVSLIVATFVLALLGTFLVRSGILESIHAFGASTIGTPFLIFIGVVLAASVALILSRLGDLRTEARLDSMLSREAFFLLNNLVLVGICFVIFWGTFFPLISEAVTGTRASVGPPWFNRYSTPLVLILVLLSGVGPVIAWRRVTASSLRRAFLVPGVVTGVTLAALLVLTSAAESTASLIMFCLVAFVIAVVGQEFARGTAARRTMTGEGWVTALGGLVARNRRRYGGYIVHVGIALLIVGVAGSSAFPEQRDVRLSPGQSMELDGYRLTYREATARILDDRSGTGAPITLGAVIDVEKDGERFTLSPSRNYFGSNAASAERPVAGFFEGEATSEVDLRWGLSHDLWSAVRPDLSVLDEAVRDADRRFAGPEFRDAQGLVVAALAERYRRQAPPAQFRTLVSPLVAWIWIGGGVVLLGALTALWPTPDGRQRRVRSLYAARVGRELSRA
ncbi:MAG: heme lyase CcmF/NrfE family subunit [Thermoleophilaceae bacterium]